MLLSRLRRLAVVPAVAALVALAFVAGPASSGAAPADVEVTILDSYAPGSETYVDCEGEEHVLAFPDGGVLLERTGDLSAELVVAVSLSGDLAPTVVDPPSEATFPAGDDWAELYLEVADAEAEGTLTVTLEPGPDHTLVEPASVDLVVEPTYPGLDCRDPLDLDPDRTDQTIDIGERPEALLGLDEVGDLEDDVVEPDGTVRAPGDVIVDGVPSIFLDGDLVTPVEGALPPGLAYADDRWTGAATTAGTYDFVVRVCIEDAFGPVPASDLTASAAARSHLLEHSPRAGADFPSICFGTEDITITVRPATVTPPPTAPPARPITARARFTG